MKKTVLYKKIDGHEIITGFDRPTVDPVETNKIVSEAIKDTPEWQAAEAKKAENTDAYKAIIEARKNRDDAAYGFAIATMSVRQDELKPMARDLAAKIIDLRRSEAVYFTPRAGEVIKTESEAKALSEAIQGRAEGTMIALDGSTVEDNRGSVYFRKSGGKWGRTELVRLGDKVPGDAVLEADVTNTQRGEIERDRVAALPVELKAKEKKHAMGHALARAAGMRSELEIQSDPDALVKSQDWYQAEVARIEGLYG